MLTYIHTKKMDKLTILYKISLWVGIPAFMLNIFNNISATGLNDAKSIVLFCICAASGLLWLGRHFLKFLKELMDVDDYYAAYKDRKKHHEQHDKK